MTLADSQALQFSMSVPPSWFEFDIWRATRTGDVARLVDQRIAGNAAIKPWRGALIKALREAAEQAERQGALLCAAMTDPAGDDGILAAVLTVFHTSGAADPALNTVDAIAAQITAIAPITGTTEWRQVTVADLPAGRAVRVTGVETTRLGSRVQDCVVMQTLTPAPAGGVINVVLVSPQTELATAMLDLFDAISATFAWTTHLSTSSTTAEGQ